MNHYLNMIIISLIPIFELRGAIPYGVLNGIGAVQAYFISVAANLLVAPLVYIFLSSLHHLFYKMGWYRKLFTSVVERARSKVHDKVEKYGYLGIFLFVAIPLPITGAYTGTLGAWILGLKRRWTILAVAAGVITAGIIVSLVMHFGIAGLDLFLKDAHL